MATEFLQARNRDTIVQFSVFTANRLGRLYDLAKLLTSENIHILALHVVDTTDSAIIRCVVDDPEKARTLMHAHGFAFGQSTIVAVELASASDLNRVLAALLEAELNIDYLYSFIPHPRGQSILALHMEDNEMAETVLHRHQFRVLRQADVSR